jgi:adenylyl cyclase-associated protein
LSNTDSCKKCALVVENVVSSLDIVNCKSAQVQVMGKAPTAVVDKTDGLNLFLSSELNVSMPGKTDQDDFVERALPEQLKTTIDGATGALMTVVVEHKG